MTIPRCPPSPCMIVMVSTNTCIARDPDHSASTKPTEMTSKRPPLQHVVDRRLDHPVDRRVGEEARGEVEDRGADVVDLVGAERLRHVADRSGQGEDQRRHRQHGEERRLGREAGDAVPHRGADGRVRRSARRCRGPGHPRRPGEAGADPRLGRGLRRFGARHGVYGNHMSSRIRAATNQPPPLVGHNVVTSDAALVEAVTRHAGASVVDDLHGPGRGRGHRRGPGARPARATGTSPS